MWGAESIQQSLYSLIKSKKEEFPGFMDYMRSGNSAYQIWVVYELAENR